MASDDHYVEVSRFEREDQFQRFAEYRVKGRVALMSSGFRKKSYVSNDDGFKGYGDPVPVGNRPSRIPIYDADMQWLKNDVVEFQKPQNWVSDPQPNPSSLSL